MIVVILIIILLLSCSCDAPRNNPLDPKNPRSIYTTLTGEIDSYSVPHTKLAQVSVYWKQGNYLTQTNTAGYFKIENLLPEDGWLILQKEGYHADSVYVNWGNQKSVTVKPFMNAMPALDRLDFYSMVVNSYPALKKFYLVISAKIVDPDNDIDSVFIENSLLKTSGLLEYDVNQKEYTKTFTIYDFNIAHFEELVGKNFTLVVMDNFSRATKIGEPCLKRVILDEVLFDSPSGYEVVSQVPTFQWQEFRLNYPFHFMLEIFTNDFLRQLVWQESNIPADSSRWTMENPLPLGEYFWIIWCIDEYSNRASSKSASFRVE